MRNFLCLVPLVVPLLIHFVQGQPPGQKLKLDLAEERRQAFSWMNNLGYPETKNLKFVLVATGDWLQQGNNAPENRFQYGFLMEEKGNSFKILTLDLEVLDFKKTPPKTLVHRTVGYEVLDLKKEVLSLVADLKTTKKEEKKPGRRMGTIFGPYLWERTEVFLLAWACAQRGLDKTAGQLYEQARNPKYNRYGEDQEKPVKTLQEKVADDLAHIEMWRGILAFGDPKVPRSDLLRRFERIVKNFPQSSHHVRARETAALLKEMVKEDKEHEIFRKKGKPFDQLTKKEQIADLIFQLRDQPGIQFAQPGWCDIFLTFSGKTDTPAHRLVDMGYDAVPQLVKVIGDKRFSRAVGFHRNFYFSHEVLRVGECAQTIIEKIAGRSFANPQFAKNSKEMKGPERARAEIMAWYAELTKKGEKGFLIEAIQRGDENSSEMATRLAKKYPEEALPILVKGARSAKIGHVRATIVGLIASFKGEKSLQFLLAELKDGPLAQPRLTAAEELHQLGRPEGLAAMIGWWKEGAETNKNKKEQDEEPAGWSFYIAEFLANCGEVEAIRALGKDLHKRPIKLRLEVVSNLGGGGGPFRKKAPAKEPAKVAEAVESLLVAALDDKDEYVGMSGSWNGKEFADPRICDMAGHVLNLLYPKKYTFDLAAQPAPRDRQLVVLKNIWRQANNLLPLPVPKPRRITPLPADKLRPLLDRYLAAGGEKCLAVRKELDNAGLAALPGVLERRDKATEKNEKAMWNELAKRLSCIVAEIKIGNRSAKLPDKLVKHLEALKGKPFDGKEFIRTIGNILKNSHKVAQGVRLVALRPGDGTGFSVNFSLLANARNVKGPPSQWGFNESVKVGKEFLLSHFGASSDIAKWTDGNYPDLEKVLAQSCGVEPAQPLEIRIYIAPEWFEK